MKNIDLQNLLKKYPDDKDVVYITEECDDPDSLDTDPLYEVENEIKHVYGSKWSENIRLQA